VKTSAGAFRRHYITPADPAPMLATLDALAGAEGVAAHISVEQ